MARRPAQAQGGLEQGDGKAVDMVLRAASGPAFCPELPSDEALRLQAEFQPLVQAAIDAPDELYKREFSRRLGELVHDGLAIKPVGSAITRSGRSSLVYAYVYRDIHAELSHGVLLLLNEQLPYAKAARRCKLPRCGRYYLAKRNPKGGPANDTYCLPEHRAEYRDSTERKAAKARKPK